MLSVYGDMIDNGITIRDAEILEKYVKLIQ